MELAPPSLPHVCRVVIVEDHDRLRRLIRSQLAADPGVRVVGEAGGGAEAIACVRRLRPDVVVLDIELGGDLDGLEVALALAADPCRILAHSSHSDPVHVASLLRAGADGYLSKEAPVGRIAAAIRAITSGEGRWFEAPPQTAGALSPGARAALAHLVAGGRPEATPDAAGLADLYAALGASSWYEALARAWALGLVGPREPVVRYEPGWPSRANVPGQASSASAGSYGA